MRLNALQIEMKCSLCTWIKALTLKLHNIACDAEMLCRFDMTCEEKAYRLAFLSVVRDLVRSLIEWLYTGLKKDKIALREISSISCYALPPMEQ